MSHAPFDQSFAHIIYKAKYAMEGEEWSDTATRVTGNVMGSIIPLTGGTSSPNLITDVLRATDRLEQLIGERKFLPGGRYLYASGRGLHQVQNCLLLRAEDTREGWADISRKSTMALMTGAGIGVNYSLVRPSGSIIERTGGIASGPISLMRMVNEVGRNVMQGGARRSAIWAGLAWWHADVFQFIRAKDWSPEVRALKEKDFTFPADLDMTNISVTLDRSFFDAYHLTFDVSSGNEFEREHGLLAPDGKTWYEWAHRVYDLVLSKMLTTAEPGFSVDYDNSNEDLRNACTEITSEDDSDVCNLGSVNMARFDDIEDFRHAVRDATLFLLAGTVYSDLPYEEVYITREKNRRLGLGLMGIHEWLMRRGKRYGIDSELGEWLAVYRDESRTAADMWSTRLGLSRPLKVRALAPNGTIGIVGETTTSGEPLFCAAYKRRLRTAGTGADKDSVQFEYVVDPTAKRMLELGIPSDRIEDAYTLALDPERRIAFQAWLQMYVDHAISSTINLPAPITDPAEQAEFGRLLMQYLPSLRGITVYPDGARGGQPLTPVDPEYALQHQGVRYEETEDRCVGGICGA